MHPWHELFDFCTKPTITTHAYWTGKGAPPLEDRGSAPPNLQSRDDPEWLHFLSEGEGIDGYLAERELAGVAFIDATNADLDWSAE